MKVIDLLKLLKSGESDVLEFKSKVTSDIGEEVTALANAFGGTILVGVRDDGQILGVDARRAKERATQYTTNIVPPVKISFETVYLDEKEILVIGVPRVNNICSIGGMAYIRIGTSKRPLSIQEIFTMGTENLLYEIDRTPTEEKEFDRDLVDDILGSNDDNRKELMRRIGAIDREGCLTLAGLLFFHLDPQSILPHTSIRMMREGERWRRYSGPMVKVIREIEKDLEQHMDRISIQIGFRRIDVPEYPLKALREGIVNSITHRNYAIKSEVFIEMGRNHIEIRNPGSFPPGTSPEEPMPVPRNPVLYELMFRSGYVERQGRGIDLISSECAEHPLIGFRYVLTANATRLRFERSDSSLSKDQRRILDFMGEEIWSSTKIAKGLGLSIPTVLRKLKDLIDMNLVEKKGKGPGTRYEIAKKVRR